MYISIFWSTQESEDLFLKSFSPQVFVNHIIAAYEHDKEITNSITRVSKLISPSRSIMLINLPINTCASMDVPSVFRDDHLVRDALESGPELPILQRQGQRQSLTPRDRGRRSESLSRDRTPLFAILSILLRTRPTLPSALPLAIPLLFAFPLALAIAFVTRRTRWRTRRSRSRLHLPVTSRLSIKIYKKPIKAVWILNNAYSKGKREREREPRYNVFFK